MKKHTIIIFIILIGFIATSIWLLENFESDQMVNMETLEPMKCGIMKVECRADGLIWFEQLEDSEVIDPLLIIKEE